MWIFTTYGFFSFTRSPLEPERIQIRARDDRDLEDLKKRHGIKAKIIETDHSDYRWRIIVDRGVAAKIMTDETLAIDYENFKNATTDRMHSRPLMSVWSSMMSVQREREATKRPGRGKRRGSNSYGGPDWLFEEFAPPPRPPRLRPSRFSDDPDEDIPF